MTPLQKVAEEIFARIRRLSESCAHRRKPEWRGPALAVCARAAAVHGDRAYCDRSAMYEMWDRKCPWPPGPSTVARLGGLAAIYSRLSKGGLGVEGRLGVWNGGFFHGLKLAGALRTHSARQWSVWERLHVELVHDMEEMTAGNRFERKTGRNGIRRLRRCPASFLPPEPADGASVVAGLFTGGVARRIEGEDWLELPAGEEILRLLDGWTILHRPSRTFRGRQYIRVPPFYAPLFVDVMPPRSLAAILSVRKPALCPLLSCIYWDITMRREGLPVIPFTGALPFSCSMRTFRRRGWKRDDLHRAGLDLGINGVDRRLKDRMAAWFGAQCRLRGRQDSGTGRAAGGPDTSGTVHVGPRPEIQASRGSP